MKFVIVRHQIKSINKNSLQYIDGNGDLQFIDFEECRKNWVEYVNKSEDFSVNNLSVNETKCIGLRNMINKPPYIEFFTDHKVKIEFKFSTFCLLPHKAFTELQAKITEIGWNTYDLS